MSSESLHEPIEQISEETIDMHRAIVSVKEELDAIDWYRQRADASTDEQLKDILLHNMNEEIEHAVMVLEWIRRHHVHFDQMMRKYLFSESPIVDIEHAEKAGAAAGPETLGIGSLNLKRR